MKTARLMTHLFALFLAILAHAKARPGLQIYVKAPLDAVLDGEIDVQVHIYNRDGWDGWDGCPRLTAVTAG